MGKQKIRITKLSLRKNLFVFLAAILVSGFGYIKFPGAKAATQTINNNVNVTALVLPPVPTIPAVIDQPVNNSKFSVLPLVVRGTCAPGLTVRIFNNNVLAGTSTCVAGGNFTINITLVTGKNVLKALNYDTYNQAGPSSANITVYAVELVESIPNSPSPIFGGKPTPNALNDNNSVEIFTGTPLQLITRAWGVDFKVSSSTNYIILILIYSTIILIIIFMFLVKRRDNKEY